MSRHHHHHSHDHGHDHNHSHDHSHVHPMGHNHDHADHLHSHLHGHSDADKAEDLQALATSFIDGFRAAEDKTSYLRLSGVPFHRTGSDGLVLHLVDAAISANWQIGTASPAFASKELVYMPFPGSMVKDRTTMTFTYVSMTERADIDLVEILRTRMQGGDIPE